MDSMDSDEGELNKQKAVVESGPDGPCGTNVHRCV